MIDLSNYKHKYTAFERVIVKSITPLGGWGVGMAEVVNLFPFYFVERESWFVANKVYNLDEFMDMTSVVPVYFFTTWDAAIRFAKTKSNRYTLGQMDWWLRFQEEYWFATIFIAMMDTVNYLKSNERYLSLKGMVKYSDRRFYKKPS